MNKEQKVLIFQIIISATFLSLAAFSLIYNPLLVPLLCFMSFLTIGYKIFLKTFKNILQFNLFDENFLMCVASCGAFILKEFFESAIIMLLYQIGEFFQNFAIYNSKKSIKNLINLKPKFTNLKTPEGLKTTEPKNLNLGDIIVIKPGEKVPIDGTIINGNSTVDTSSLTGEAKSKFVKPGDKIISGCINLTETIEIKVETLYKNCTIQKILNLIENQHIKKSYSENFITKFSKIYTPIIVLLAVILATVPTIFFSQNWNFWLDKSIILIAISCPCALVISIPLSFFGGISTAAKNLILIKGSYFIETLSKAKTIMFDKTGTLTIGKFKIIKTNPANTNEKNLIETLINAENLNNHPIAHAITNTYKNKIKTNNVLNTKNFPGMGIKVQTKNNDNILVGNSKLMKKFKIKHDQPYSNATVVHIAKNGLYLGNVIINDSIKPEAKITIKNLHNLNIKNLIMLTGDEENTAKHIYKHLKLDAYYANLLPHEKVRKIQQFQKNNKDIIFIGDGINDVPALLTANIGIAMGKTGSDAAIEASDIVLMSNNLKKITQAIIISKKTMKTIKQNIVLSLGIKFLILIIGLFFPLNIWLATCADVGTSTLAVLNALKTLKFKINN